jgi:hypothetical protein
MGGNGVGCVGVKSSIVEGAVARSDELLPYPTIRGWEPNTTPAGTSDPAIIASSARNNPGGPSHNLSCIEQVLDTWKEIAAEKG